MVRIVNKIMFMRILIIICLSRSDSNNFDTNFTKFDKETVEAEICRTAEKRSDWKSGHGPDIEYY